MAVQSSRFQVFLAGALTVLFAVLVSGALSLSSGALAGDAAPAPAAPGAAPAPADAAHGKLEFEAITFDGGSVKQGVTIEASFKFTNKGNSPITIGNIRTSCGCTAAVVSGKDGSKTFAPGESGTISATVRTEHKRGAVSSTITVETDSPEQASVVLTITAKVSVDVELNPQYVVFGPVTPNDPPTTRVLKLTNNTDKAIQVKLATNTRPEEVSLDWKERSLAGGESVEFTVTIKPKKVEPGFYANLQFDTDIPNSSPIVLAVSGQVTAPPAEAPAAPPPAAPPALPPAAPVPTGGAK